VTEELIISVSKPLIRSVQYVDITDVGVLLGEKGSQRAFDNMIDEAYFHTFDMERICIDKVFFLVYDEQYVQEDHFLIRNSGTSSYSM
jgi:hypothetical protein